MGFKDFECFNNALLAKQGWRLLTNPNSLVGRLLKAKYFPNVSFLKAELGRCPSFLWRSIWDGKALLQEGLRWKIGYVSEVGVMDRWLPKPHNFRFVLPIIIWTQQ